MSNPNPKLLSPKLPYLPNPSQLPQQLMFLATRIVVIRTVVVPLSGRVDTISGVDDAWMGGNPI